MKWVAIRSDDHLRIDYVQGSPSNALLAVTFTNWAPPGQTRLDGLGYAGKFLLAHGFDLVAFKANRNDWFQDVEAADFARLEAALAAGGRGYRRRVGYGSSMGGYAAIQFSGALRLDRVLAFSPQFAIDGDWDRRWAREASAIALRHRIAPACLGAACDYVIAFDPRDPDLAHVGRFARTMPPGRLREIRLPYSGHPTGDFIAETGHLKPFALAVLRDDAPPPLATIRRDRGRSAAYFFTMAQHCARRAKPRTALALIERAIAIDARKAHYHWQRSLVLARLGRMSDSTDSARAAMDRAPDDPLYATHLAHLLSSQGDAKGALAAIDRVLALDPKQPEAHRQRAILLAHQGDIAGAVAAQRLALSLGNGADAQQAAFLSHLLTRAEDFAGALPAIDQAIARDAGVAGFHGHRSAVLDRLGKIDAAVEAAERAVALAPGEAQHLVQLSQVLARKGMIEAALDCAARAVRLAPDKPWYHRHLGALQEIAGRGDLAIDAARLALKLGPDDPSHARHLQELMERYGHADIAAAE